MWNELWEQHKGKLSGLIGGVLLSLVYLFFGFWDMLITGFIVGVGFLVGKQADERKLGFVFEEMLSWLNERWRLFK
jgi:uncharacterized membrane protein